MIIGNKKVNRCLAEYSTDFSRNRTKMDISQVRWWKMTQVKFIGLKLTGFVFRLRHQKDEIDRLRQELASAVLIAKGWDDAYQAEKAGTKRLRGLISEFLDAENSCTPPALTGFVGMERWRDKETKKKTALFVKMREAAKGEK